MEQEYFWLRMDQSFPLGIELPPFSKEEQRKMEPAVHFITTRQPLRNTVFQDYLSTSLLSGQIHLVSDALKELFVLYLPGERWIPVVLVDQEQQQHLYWFCTPGECDCLHPDTTYDIGGAVISPVLEQRKTGKQSLFCIRTKKQTLLILRLDLVESILRREFYGLHLARVLTRD